MQHTLTYRNSHLSYQKTGTGEKVIITFHGFGQNNTAFNELIEPLKTNYTFYAFDLFFHGGSKWNEGETTLEKAIWKEILLQFINRHQLNRFSLVGFSMGAKFVLATLEDFGDRVDQVYLVAPDGIKPSYWYRLATFSQATRYFFKRMILNPNLFYRVTSILEKLPFIDGRLLRFAESQMNTREKREKVYYSWVVFRHLKFKMKKIAYLTNHHSIHMMILVGKKDKVIPEKNIHRLSRHLPSCKLIILKTGHNRLLSESIQILIKSLSSYNSPQPA